MCLEKFSALENITLAACRELSLAAPLNSVPLHSDRIPFRYAPWQTAFPNISTPETEERVMRSLVAYLEDQSVQGRSFLKTLQIKNLSRCVLDAPGLFSTSIVGPALANLTTLGDPDPSWKSDPRGGERVYPSHVPGEAFPRHVIRACPRVLEGAAKLATPDV